MRNPREREREFSPVSLPDYDEPEEGELEVEAEGECGCMEPTKLVGEWR